MSPLLFILTIVTIFQKASSDCVENFKTTCDFFSDIKKFKTEASRFGELIIGDLRYTSPIHTYHLNDDVPTLNDKFFESLPNLYSLTIVSQINYVWMEKKDHPGVDYVNLYKNDLDSLHINAFKNLVDLRTLVLRDNKIANFLTIFNSTSVRVLDVSTNVLKIIKTGQFSNTRITWINLKNNQIAIIGQDTFPPTLKILSLDYNKLEQVNEDVLHNLENLEELTMTYNKLRDAPQVKNLKNVKLLDFSHNEIKFLIDNYSRLSKLNYLDLSYNKIAQIYNWGDDISNDYMTIRVSLAFNRLVGISYNGILSLFGNDRVITNNTLSLYGNPLYCGCLKQMRYYFWSYVINMTDCDKRLFESGETPYCVAESLNCDQNITEVSDEDYADYITAVADRWKKIDCDLRETFYKERNYLIPRRNLFD